MDPNWEKLGEYLIWYNRSKNCSWLLRGVLYYFLIRVIISNLFVDMRDTRTKYVCENDVMHLSCTSPKVLKIHGADYGGSEVSVCGEGKASNVPCKVIDRTDKIKFVCDNKSSCSLVAMTRIFGDPCPSSSKYLNVIYACGKFIFVIAVCAVLNFEIMLSWSNAKGSDLCWILSVLKQLPIL